MFRNKKNGDRFLEKEKVMGLDIIVNSLEDVDETIKHLYVKDGDNFILDVMGVTSHPSVTALKSSLTKERDARKSSDKALKQIQSDTEGLDLEKLKNIDPDKYVEALKNLEKLESEDKKRNNKKLKDKQEWEKLGQQLQDDFDTKIVTLTEDHNKNIKVFQTKLDDINKAKDETVKAMMASLESEMKDKEIISAISDAKGNRVILMPHIEKYVQVVQDENGKFASRVINSDKIVRINDSGNPMTISEFVKELKDKKEFQGEGIFEKDKQPGGSGSGGNQGGDDDGTVNPFKKDTFDLTAQGKLYKTDPVEYKRLQALAEKG